LRMPRQANAGTAVGQGPHGPTRRQHLASSSKDGHNVQPHTPVLLITPPHLIYPIFDISGKPPAGGHQNIDLNIPRLRADWRGGQRNFPRQAWQNEPPLSKAEN
jgi:hypothetical protein